MKSKTADKKRQKKTRPGRRPSVTIGSRRAIVMSELLAGRTRQTAAARARISTRTLDRITADPDFRVEFEAARQTAFNESLATLKGGAILAAQTLCGLLKSRRVSERRQAAVAILTFAMKSHEVGEIETRIRALEKTAAEISSKAGALVN